jgi:hypothetical protein
MLVVTVIFVKVRGFILNRSKETLMKKLKINTTGTNAKIGKQYKKKDGEKVDGKKFAKGMFGLLDPVGWLKDIASLFNLRKITIYLLIAGVIFGYGYYKANLNKPVQTNLSYDKEFRLNLERHGEYIYKPKYSNDLQLRDLATDKVIKTFKAKDLGELSKKLNPVALQLKPIGVIGYGVGSLAGSNAFEAGGGVSFLRYWKWALDAFLTNKGIYLGTSYSITDNSSLGLGAGKGFENDNRVIFYYKWRF